MIYIVHGNDYAKSRKAIVNQKSKVDADHIVEEEIENITPRQLYEMLVSFDLFGKPPFIILKVPATKVANFEDYLKILFKTPEQSVLIILCATTLGRTNDFIKYAQELKAKVAHNEKLNESNVFDFVDNLYYKNKKAAYAELQKLEKEETDEFYVFSMVLYGLRNIAQAKFRTEEFQKKSGFMKDKAIRQAENFTVSEIYELFDFFYDTEKKLKTGKIDKSLVIPFSIEKVLANHS